MASSKVVTAFRGAEDSVKAVNRNTNFTVNLFYCCWYMVVVSFEQIAIDSISCRPHVHAGGQLNSLYSGVVFT